MKKPTNEFEYIRSFITPDTEFLRELELSSRERGDIQPPVEREIGRFLSLLVRLTRAELVLELGSGAGYSGLWLAGSLEKTGGKLITIDGKERLHLEAVENYSRAGHGERVEALLGDIPDVLETRVVPRYKGAFDIVFQDSGKSLYPALLQTTWDLLKPGGLLVADDTLFKVNNEVRSNLGRYTDEYNRMVFERDDIYSVILPVGHGLTISIKGQADDRQ
ncbi:MAG: O-methyltransferase [Spirochaetales bacterium]|nr:O-methyltransferase [Spirochaetales bacterium]